MTLTAAIVGLGWWGRLMVEEAQKKAPGLQITHAVVRNIEAARETARELGLTLTAHLDDVLRDPAIGAVVIASPHAAHVAQIKAAAAAGKAIYTEKPLSIHVEDAAEALAAVASAKLLIGIGTDRRFLPAMQRLAGLVREGAIGRPFHVEAQYSNDFMSRGISGAWRMDESQAPGAGMTGPGLHALDAMIALMGPVAEVCGRMVRPAGPAVPLDAVSVLLSFASGASGLLGVVRGVPNYFRLAIFGDGGWVEMRGFGAVHLRRSGEEENVEHFPAALAIGETMQIFAECWRKGEPFPVSPHDMLVTQTAFVATLHALKEPGWQPVPAVPVKEPDA